jgi:hypothetical protein
MYTHLLDEEGDVDVVEVVEEEWEGVEVHVVRLTSTYYIIYVM